MEWISLVGGSKLGFGAKWKSVGFWELGRNNGLVVVSHRWVLRMGGTGLGGFFRWMGALGKRLYLRETPLVPSS